MTSIIPTIIYVLLVAYSYVLSIHIGAIQGYRNDPVIMKFRIKRILLITTINLILAPIVLIYILKTVPDFLSVLQILGIKNIFKWGNLFDIFKTMLLFMILFCGPLVDQIFDPNNFSQYMSNLEIFRDLILAPLTEELFFTSLTTGSILAYELSKNLIIKSSYSPTLFHNVNTVDLYLRISPLLFGFAHLHHAIELKRNGHKLLQIIVSCGFQCIYTTLFGYLTNRVFVNTGNLWCCFIAHSFCNFMGLPKLDTNGCLSYRIGYWMMLILGVVYFGSYFELLTTPSV